MVDSKYLRCGVVRRKKIYIYIYCVPEAPSAEQVSERYSNEARCAGTRCCVDREVVLCVDQRGAVRKGEEIYVVFFVLPY